MSDSPLPPPEKMDSPLTRPPFDLWSMAFQVMKIQQFLREMSEKAVK